MRNIYCSRPEQRVFKSRVMLKYFLDERNENMYKVISEEKTENTKFEMIANETVKRRVRVRIPKEFDYDEGHLYLQTSEHVHAPPLCSRPNSSSFFFAVLGSPPILHIWLDSWFIVKHFRTNKKHHENEKSKESSHESDWRASIEFQEAKIIMPIQEAKEQENDVKNDTFFCWTRRKWRRRWRCRSDRKKRWDYLK